MHNVQMTHCCYLIRMSIRSQREHCKFPHSLSHQFYEYKLSLDETLIVSQFVPGVYKVVHPLFVTHHYLLLFNELKHIHPALHTCQYFTVNYLTHAPYSVI